MYNIQEHATLVDLTLCQWSAKRKDAPATNRVARLHGADRRAGQYIKRLVRSEALSELHLIARKAREHHRSNTCGWFDKGPRLLPNKNHLDYVAAQGAFKAQHESAAQRFCRAYPTYRDEAKTMLKGLYREADYPTVESLRRKFVYTTTFFPVPAGEHFLLEMNEKIVRHLQRDLDEKVNSAANATMQELWQRLFGAVNRMSRALTNYDPTRGDDRRAGTIRESMVDHLREIADLLPKLNWAGDPHLDAMRHELVRSLCPHDASDLRDNPILRRKVLSDADQILENMAPFVMTEEDWESAA